MSKGNCNEEKRQSYNQGFLEGREVGRFDGRKDGAIAELKANLHLLDDLKGMNFSANWYRRQIKLRIKELCGETK